MKSLDNIAFGVVGNVLVTVHTDKAPTDAEWEAYAEVAKRREYDHILVRSGGGGPTTKQRAMVKEEWGDLPVIPRAALLTSSRFVRGIATACNWILGQTHIKAFPLDGLEDALDYLGGRDAVTLAPQIRAAIRTAMIHFEAPGRAVG